MIELSFWQFAIVVVLTNMVNIATLNGSVLRRCIQGYSVGFFFIWLTVSQLSIWWLPVTWVFACVGSVVAVLFIRSTPLPGLPDYRTQFFDNLYK